MKKLGRPSIDPLIMLLVVIATVTLIRVITLTASQLDLHGDEAQYWSWSEVLDWGYYTKPPAIAWIIHFTTALFGDSEWAVRLSSPLLHSGTSLLCGLIAHRLYGEKALFWGGILFLTLPAVSFSSCIISTDVPLLFFWALALYSMINLLENRHPLWAIVLGITIGFGILSKYAMAYFIICLVLSCFIIKRDKWFLKSWQAILTLTTAILTIFPNILWNIDSDWVTVAHLGDNVNLKGELFNISHAGIFLAEQAGIFGPILFLILLFRIIAVTRGTSENRETWLLCYVLPVLAIVTVQAVLSRANANWAAPAYIAATILVTGWIINHSNKWILWVCIPFHTAIMLAVIIYYLGIPGIEPPLKSDPLRKLRGWQETSDAIAKIMVDRPNHILLSEDRKVMASLLYGLRHKMLNPLIWDYDGHPNHHYELTAKYKPKTGDEVLLVAKWEYPYPILNQFASKKSLGTVEVPIGKGIKRKLYLFELADYASNQN